MPEDILNNIRAFVRNQSASSLMQMMQNNHETDITLQEAEPILDMIDMSNSTIQHSQDSNQTISNTTHHSDQNTIQNQTVSITTDDSWNTQTWQDKLLNVLDEYHCSDDESENEDLEGDFLKKHKQQKINIKNLIVPNFFSFSNDVCSSTSPHCHNN